MENSRANLVILLTGRADPALSATALLTKGGPTAGLETVISRERGRPEGKMTHLAPLNPLAAMIADFRKCGGTICACAPCVKGEAGLLDGVNITGASAMHAEIKAGAATLSF